VRRRKGQQPPASRKKARSQSRVGLPLHAVRTQQLDHERLAVACRMGTTISRVSTETLDDSFGPEPAV
jgi:hypothetical protein